MSLIDQFAAAADELESARDGDACLDTLNKDTERLLDDLLGRHEDDDFPALGAELLASFED